jgi:hypothetical protein
MKRLFPMGVVFLANDVLAHPGHGKPGSLHFHEFPDALILVIGLVAVGLVCWAWKK